MSAFGVYDDRLIEKSVWSSGAKAVRRGVGRAQVATIRGAGRAGGAVGRAQAQGAATYGRARGAAQSAYKSGRKVVADTASTAGSRATAGLSAVKGGATTAGATLGGNVRMAGAIGAHEGRAAVGRLRALPTNRKIIYGGAAGVGAGATGGGVYAYNRRRNS
jgi:hypothetical protein